jgi:hypothetical protein
MARLKIEVFEGGARSATITLPTWLVVGASKMLPKIAGKDLKEHIDIERIVEMAKDPSATGIVLDIEDHEDQDRILISIVGDEAEAKAKALQK